MTKSGDHCEGNENRKSQKPFIFANWTILSIFKKKFFWMIQIFQKSDLKKVGSRFFLDLKKTGSILHYNLPFLRIWKKSNVENLFKKIQRYQKMHVFLIIGWSGFFLENPAPLSFLILCPLTSDQKSERSIARLPRSGTVTHTHTIFPGYNSTRSWELQRACGHKSQLLGLLNLHNT